MGGEQLKRFLTDTRRDFHKYAESGWREFRTTSKIADYLHEIGFEVKLGKEIINPASAMGRPDDAKIKSEIERALEQGANRHWIDRMCGFTGVVGVLETGRKGSVTAFRFDIDSNDISEAQEEKHRPFAQKFGSVNPLMAHTCGHDGHAAIGLALARVLVDNKESLCGVIKLVFQPAEEGLRGGKAIADSGILDDVNFLFGGHIGFSVPTGHIYTSCTGMLASTKLDVRLAGKSAHAGAAPNEGHNALLAAASMTVLLSGITPHKDGATRLNVGVLNAGVGRNVIAPSAYMQIETRGWSSRLNEYVYDNALRIIENVANIYEVTYKIELVGSADGSESDGEAAAIVAECAAEINGVHKITVHDEPANLGGSEDFTWMLKKVQEHGGKGTYAMLGADIAAPHHNEYFDFDEDVLPIGVDLYYRIALKSASIAK